MRATNLEEALRHAPFRPFEIYADGRVIAVDHPEQVYLTPGKTTVIVAHPDESIHILDVDHISSLTLRRRSAKSSKLSSS